MKNKKIFILIGMMLIAGIIGAESFVLPRRKRQTTANIKEDSGQQLGAIIEECAQVITAVNNVQKESIQQMHELLAQQQNSFFTIADKTKLQEYGQLLTKVVDDLRVTQKRMMNNFTDLKNTVH